MFIVLEGIDCSGKSELTQILARKLGGVAYTTPPKRYRELRKKVDTDFNLQRHYEFYRDAVIGASAEISSMLSIGQTVVCDRYWLSTLVYHRAGGMVLDGSDFSNLVQPNLTVFLLVSPEIQAARSSKRASEGGNINGVQSRLTDLYWQALIDLRLPFVAISTDNNNLEQCGNIVLTAASNV